MNDIELLAILTAHFEKALAVTGASVDAFERTCAGYIMRTVKQRHGVWLWMRTNRMSNGTYPSYPMIQRITGASSHNGPRNACLGIPPEEQARITRETLSDAMLRARATWKKNLAARWKREGLDGADKLTRLKVRKYRRMCVEEMMGLGGV